VILFALAPFLVMLPRFRTLAGAMCASFLFGWIYLLIPLYWMVFMVPLTLEEPPIAAMITMWLLACGIQMLWFLAIGFMGYLFGRGRPVFTFLVLLPLLWAGIEAARLHLPVPGPLVHAGEALHTITVLIQAADIGGVYLVSIFVLLVNGCAALVLDRQLRGQTCGKRLGMGVMIAAFIVMGGYGAWRLASLGGEIRADGPLVVCIQPNVGQEQKNREYAASHSAQTPGALSSSDVLTTDYDAIPNQYDRVSTMTIDAARKYPDADLFIWPETAMPMVMPPGYGVPVKQLADATWSLTKQEQDGALSVISWLEPGGKLVRTRIGKPLLFGVEVAPSQFELSQHPYLADEEKYNVKFNSAVLLDATGQPQGRHDKVKLVPAGEYIPLRTTPLGDFAAHYMRELAGYVPKLLPGDSTLLDHRRFGLKPHAGDGRAWEFTANVCYEYAFCDLYVGLHHQAPVDFAVTLSNEAWYGRHAELDQAVIASKFRAIESRASFVRCTNSGVTCVIDAMGREVSRHTTGVDGDDRLFSGVYAQNVPVFDQPRHSVWQSTLGAITIPLLMGFALASVAAMVVMALCMPTVWLRRRARRHGRKPRAA